MRILALCIAMTACIPALPQDQAASEQPQSFRVTAKKQQLDGSTVRFSGNVEIESAAFVLQADEATYHLDTGEIEAHGNVRMKTDEGEITASDVNWKPTNPPIQFRLVVRKL